MNIENRIAVITPIHHLNGIQGLLASKGKIFYLEYGTKDEVRQLILNNGITSLLCNPNRQGYKIDGNLLQGSRVNIINTCSTGLNHIDLEYCKINGISVLSLTKDFDLIDNLPSTAELAFGLMLSLLRKIPQGSKSVLEYNWDYMGFVGRQVKDLNVGIVGFGRLGKLMDSYCRAFGAKTFINDPYQPVEQTSLEEMFEICDVISLHVHVNKDTKYMINYDLLKLSRRKLYLINTSRGEIVEEHGVVRALEENLIAGYGTDVLENEFDNIRNSPIINAMILGHNIIATPHIGGMTVEGQTLAYKYAINKFENQNS